MQRSPHKPFSLRGYEAMANQFAELVQVVNRQPNYLPNEPHLSKAGLAEMVKKLQGHNQAVRKRAQPSAMHG